MLKGIDPLLTPELLHMIAAMGHGDELALVDANFPATAMAQRLVRLPASSTARALEAVLTLLPLDTFVANPAMTMQVVGDAAAVPDAVRDFGAILDRAESRRVGIEGLERHAFYERTRRAFGVVSTGELRPYGNIILVKGVVFVE